MRHLDIAERFFPRDDTFRHLSQIQVLNLPAAVVAPNASRDKSEATRNNLLGIAEREFRIARGVDAVDERVKRKPTSSWVRSRFNGSDDQRREPT